MEELVYRMVFPSTFVVVDPMVAIAIDCSNRAEYRCVGNAFITNYKDARYDRRLPFRNTMIMLIERIVGYLMHLTCSTQLGIPRSLCCHPNRTVHFLATFLHPVKMYYQTYILHLLPAYELLTGSNGLYFSDETKTIDLARTQNSKIMIRLRS